MTETKVETYSPVIGAQKAGKNFFVQILIWGLGLLLTYPDIILKLLGQWKEMTLGAVVIYLLNYAYNWLQNKNLGK
jgi:hypothetical protein